MSNNNNNNNNTDEDKNKAALNAKQRGIDHYVAARYQEAEQAFTEAISIATKDDPSLHLYYSNRCASRMNLEKIEEALVDAKKTTELKRDFRERMVEGWDNVCTDSRHRAAGI